MAVDKAVRTSPFCRIYMTERGKGSIMGNFELSPYLGGGFLIKYEN